MSMKDVDDVIEAYRAQLVAEAEIGARELDEIEDHLRSLTEDLRATGMPATAAVTEAARRLGDPCELAREHARVRGAFGAKLSMARRISAAALLVPMLYALTVYGVGSEGVWSRSGAELVFGVVLFGALLAGFTWARPVLLGGLAFFAFPSVLMAVLWPGQNLTLLLPLLGVVAFLAPWRRGELTAAGASLALQVWAYGAASWALNFQYTSNDGTVPVAPFAQVAFNAAMIATVGGILRARWSSIAAAVSAVSLIVAAYELGSLTFRISYAGVMSVSMMGLVISGAVAAAVASVLAWRSSRSPFGTLRELVR